MDFSEWLDSKSEGDALYLAVKRSENRAFEEVLRSNPFQIFGFMTPADCFNEWDSDTIFFVMRKNWRGWVWDGTVRLLNSHLLEITFSDYLKDRVCDLSDILFEE